jgi:protein tyrosine phosphatase
MLMEQKGTIIVMVTNLTEGTRLKCHQYWPEATHTETHGDITVEGLDEKVAPMMVTRKFSVTYAGETREVIQFQYVLFEPIQSDWVRAARALSLLRQASFCGLRRPSHWNRIS